MKLSFFSASMERYPIERVFQAAQEFGYEAMELWGGRPHAYAPDLADGDVKKVKQLSKDYRLPIISFEPDMVTLSWKDPRWHKENMDYYKVCLDMISELECPYMVLAALHAEFGNNYKDDWNQLIDSVGILAQHAEKRGVTILLETIAQFEGYLIHRCDDIIRVMDEVKSPYVKGMLDMLTAITANEPSSEYFEKLGKDLKHIHLVDGKKDNEAHLIAGDGELPFEEVLAMIHSYGYDGYCSLEHFDEYRGEPILFNHQAIRRVRAALQNIGLE